jgi:pimeloyl-ACP methyl ester carboxylesterase
LKRWQKVISISLVVVLLVVLVGPFLVPVPPLMGTTDEQSLADPDSHFVEVNGLSVHYKEMGQGEPVFVLLHGFGASLFSWREVMEPLSHFGRVITYDRPAFGLTERPMPGDWKGVNPYSVQGNVELLAGLLDELGVEQAILVGNSAGGGVAVAFALEHPERVQALVLVDPALGSGKGERFPAWALPLLATPQMRHLGQLLVRNIAGKSGDETIRLAWHDPSKIGSEVFAGYRKPLKANNWDKALYEFSIARNPEDYRSRLAELAMPILVVTGDDDRIVPTQGTMELAGEIPSAQLIVFNGCGHVPHEECPDQFMSAMEGFLAAIK